MAVRDCRCGQIRPCSSRANPLGQPRTTTPASSQVMLEGLRLSNDVATREYGFTSPSFGRFRKWHPPNHPPAPARVLQGRALATAGRAAGRCLQQVRRGVGKGGRCRNHDGMSTGPKTSEGRKRISSAQRHRWIMYRLRKEREEREALHARFDAAYAAHQAKVEARRRRP